MSAEATETKRRHSFEVRHSRSCPAGADREAGCKCKPAYRVTVWSKRDGRRIRRTFQSYGEARSWRAEATTAVEAGKLRAAEPKTVRQAAEELLSGMEDGTVRAKTGRPYKPSVIESYRASLERHVLPDSAPIASPTSARRTSSVSPTGCACRARRSATR